MAETSDVSGKKPGTVLCQKHAEQVARRGLQPHGECEPLSWPNGSGETITCDVVAHPERVAAYRATL